jgi:hypothetical protein
LPNEALAIGEFKIWRPSACGSGIPDAIAKSVENSLAMA